MFNKEQAISILIQAADVAQASGKLKLHEASMIAQAIAVLQVPSTAAQGKKAIENTTDESVKAE